MQDDRMPTLFEILNRFSKPPVDLWSFYVFLKEHYGGVEYLEFWLDCASHTALCKELAKEILQSKHQSENSGHNSPQRVLHVSRESHSLAHQGFTSPDFTPHGFASHGFSAGGENYNAGSQANNYATGAQHSPSSSVLFDILREDVLETSYDQNRDQRSSHNTSNEERQDAFDTSGQYHRSKRYSTVSMERAQKKRDTVSRLSEILDNMQMPEYPEYPHATATSPTRNPSLAAESVISHRRLPSDLDDPYRSGNQLELDPVDTTGSPYNLSQHYSDLSDRPEHQNPRHDYNVLYPDSSDIREAVFDSRQPPQTPPPKVALTSGATGSGNPAALSTASIHTRTSSNLRNATILTNESSEKTRTALLEIHRAVQDSALRIIYTYLTPKSSKVIELPSDATGWSMADDIRQATTIPGGLDNPRIFDPATIYVFDALEREALPAFLMYRALSNVQPVSATLRLVVGELALFGAFWLSFTFVLLDWNPKSHRCWIILPFALGWYLIITALYHIDPMLALTNIGERDGGGFAKVQENFVRKMLLRRSILVLVATTLLTAAFSVLFIFVPGHRL